MSGVHVFLFGPFPACLKAPAQALLRHIEGGGNENDAKVLEMIQHLIPLNTSVLPRFFWIMCTRYQKHDAFHVIVLRVVLNSLPDPNFFP